MHMKTLAAALMATVMTGVSALAVETGAPAPDFTLKDASGKEHKLAELRGKYVVLEWTNYGCPFVVKHYSKGNMQALQKEWTGKGVVWLSICSSAPGMQGYYSAADLPAETTKHGFSGTAYLLDEDGTVGRAYEAKTTPHIYVINPEGTLIYQGAIDSIRSTDSDDIAKAENYVTKTLTAALAGQPVDPSTTVPYGCSVKYAK